jgi:hypothetical protein
MIIPAKLQQLQLTKLNHEYSANAGAYEQCKPVSITMQPQDSRQKPAVCDADTCDAVNSKSRLINAHTTSLLPLQVLGGPW